MDKFTKVQKAIDGETLDSIPFSFWSHYPKIDREPKKIAQKTYENFKKFDLDFIKTLNNGMYSVEDYGSEIDFSEVFKGGVAKITKSPVIHYEDWKNITKISTEEAALSRELEYLQLLLDKVDGEAPVIMTVFSPFTTAYKLSEGRIVDHIKNDDKGYVHQALKNIAETTAELSSKAIELGAAGVYFASQMSSYEKTEASVFKEYGVPYDLQALEGAQEGWFNAIHIHGSHIMFDLVKDYPVDVINWHIGESLPEVDEGIFFSDRTVMGGIERMDITNQNKNEVRNQIYQTFLKTNGKRLILTPGCGVRLPFNEEMIDFIIETKKEIEQKMF